MKTKIIQNIKTIILALILVIGVSYVSAYSTWTAPTATAPGNNTDTPLNVGNTGQVKIGGLTLNTGGATNGLIVQNGNVGIGTASPSAGLKLDVEGKVGATEYCDQNGNNCKAITAMGGVSYTAGTGISITGSTISANTAVIQARINGTCGAGQAIKTINSDGTVTCQSVSPVYCTYNGRTYSTGAKCKTSCTYTTVKIGFESVNRSVEQILTCYAPSWAGPTQNYYESNRPPCNATLSC